MKSAPKAPKIFVEGPRGFSGNLGVPRGFGPPGVCRAPGVWWMVGRGPRGFGRVGSEPPGVPGEMIWRRRRENFQILGPNSNIKSCFCDSIFVFFRLRRENWRIWDHILIENHGFTTLRILCFFACGAIMNLRSWQKVIMIMYLSYVFYNSCYVYIVCVSKVIIIHCVAAISL